MSQLYYLLRNNRQSGPYSPDILASLPLTNKDLVKIAGNNTGWFYPQELGLPFTKNEAQSGFAPVHDQFQQEIPPATAGAIDHTLEELSQKVSKIHSQLKQVEKTYHEDVIKLGREQEAEDAASGPARKPFPLVILIFSVIGLAVIAVGLLSLNRPSSQKQVNGSAGASKQQPAITQTQIVSTPLPVIQDTAATAGPEIIVEDTALVHPPIGTTPKWKKSYPPIKKKKLSGNKTGRKENTTVAQLKEHSIKKTEERIAAKIFFVAPEGQKKTFFQKLGELFKKRKEDVGNKTFPITLDNIYDRLPVTISTSNYFWLTGVQGLILTMRNNSSQYIRQAVVHVIYYNGEDGILEKQAVSFSSIAPGGAVSVAAPDHPYAHRAGYEIVSVAVVKP